MATPSPPQSTSMDRDDVSFGIRHLELGQSHKDVVAQCSKCSPYGDPDCYCAFVSICNYLMLFDDFDPSAGEYIKIYGQSVFPGTLVETGWSELHGSVLLDFLKFRFIRGWTRMRDTPWLSGGYTDFELDKENISNFLLHLPCATCLDVGLDSPTRFEPNILASLCGYLGIPLLHGWLVDPDNQPKLYSLLGCDGLEYVSDMYDKSCDLDSTPPEEVDLMIEFLTATNSTGLTPYGLASLRTEVKDGRSCVLHANGHYRVIYNRQGTLFYLVTDKDMSNEHVWKSLELVDEEGFYVTDAFVPVKNQKNLQKANRWYNEDLEKIARAIELEDKQQADATKKKKKKKKKKGGDKSTVYQAIDGASAAPPSHGRTNSDHDSANASDHDGANASDHDNANDMEDMELKFLGFLENFKRGGSEVPYFKGMEALMHRLGIVDIAIPFAFMKEYDQTMAVFIQDNYESVYEKLRLLIASYLIDLNFHIHLGLPLLDVIKKLKLDITDLPKPKCIQTFEYFISNNDLWNGDSTSYIGRKMGTGFLNHILYWLGKGKCWGGDWNKSDMEVRNNGIDFVITKIPKHNLSKDYAYKDLMKFIDIVMKAFKNKRGEFPAYFDEFQVDVMNMPDPLEDPDKWWKFLKLMRSNFALKAPLVRSAFLCNVYRVADSLRLGMPPTARVFAPFDNSTDFVGDWRQRAREYDPLRKV